MKFSEWAASREDQESTFDGVFLHEDEKEETCEECGRGPAESVDCGLSGEMFLCAVHVARYFDTGNTY